MAEVYCGSDPFASGHAQLNINGTYPSITQRQTNGSEGYWLHHVDVAGIYHLYGGRGATNGTDWNWSFRAYPNQDGNRVEFRTDARAPIFYDLDNTTYYINGASTSVLNALNFPSGSSTINTTTPGTSGYQLNFTGQSTPDYAQAITWGWATSGAQAGIYVQSSGSYGTKMYLATTDSFATGSKTAITINEAGNVTFNRNSAYISLIYDRDNTGYYLDPASASRMNSITYDNLYFSGDTSYGFLGRNVYADTVNGRGSDSLELNYYDGGEVHIGAGYSKTLRAGALYTNGAVYGNIYYDSANTTYYVDPSSITSLRTVGSWRSDSAAWDGEFNGKIQYHVNSWYFQAADSWLFRNSGTTNVFSVNQSGVAIAVGDMRAPIFYDSGDTGYYLNPNGSSYLYSLILSGNAYFRPSTWIQFDANYGLYWPNSYGAHFNPNTASSYTQLATQGSKNSYGGLYDYYSAVNGIMYDSGGNGGVYREANGRWYFYYNLGNDCMGIGTSSTSSTYSLYLNKGVYAQSRIDATIFYDTNNTGYYCDPNSTSVLHTLINNVGWLEVRSNVYATNPTTESGLFFGWNKSGGTGEANIIVDGGANTGQFLFQRYNGGGSYTDIFQADIYGLTANSGTVNVFSDIRLKTNITNATPKLSDLMKLNVVNYEFVGEYSVLGKQLGFIAQEVEQIFPSLVREQDTRQYDEQGNYIKGYEDTKILKVGMEFAMLVKAMQEQQSIINSLKSEIETLKQKQL